MTSLSSSSSPRPAPSVIAHTQWPGGARRVRKYLPRASGQDARNQDGYACAVAALFRRRDPGGRKCSRSTAAAVPALAALSPRWLSELSLRPIRLRRTACTALAAPPRHAPARTPPRPSGGNNGISSRKNDTPRKTHYSSSDDETLNKSSKISDKSGGGIITGVEKSGTPALQGRAGEIYCNEFIP